MLSHLSRGSSTVGFTCLSANYPTVLCPLPRPLPGPLPCPLPRCLICAAFSVRAWAGEHRGGPRCPPSRSVRTTARCRSRRSAGGGRRGSCRPGRPARGGRAGGSRAPRGAARCISGWPRLPRRTTSASAPTSLASAFASRTSGLRKRGSAASMGISRNSSMCSRQTRELSGSRPRVGVMTRTPVASQGEADGQANLRA